MCNSLAYYNMQRAEGFMPKYMPKIIDKEQECGICLEKVHDQNSRVQALYHFCGKFFHQNCIYPWLSIKHTCPHDSASVNEETLEHCEIDQSGKVTKTEGTLPEVQPEQPRGFRLLYWKPTTDA
jgi:hypothetical protein